jgi:hypothetical protein
VLVIARRGYAEEPSAFSGAKAEDLGNGKYRFQIEVSNEFAIPPHRMSLLPRLALLE